MQNSHFPKDRQNLSLSNIAKHAAFAMGAIVIVSVLALLLFPNPFLNKIIKPRIIMAFSKACPAYSLRVGNINYSLFKNRLDLDSVALSKNDSTLSGNLGSLSVHGIGWLKFLWRGKPASTDFDGSAFDAYNILLNFKQSQYILRCNRIHASVADSELVFESVEFQPSCDDEQLFAESEFRKTRFHLVIPNAKLNGAAWLELLKGNKYHVRSAQIQDAFLDVLVNKDKPCAYDNAYPPLPNKMLASIKSPLLVDSLNIINGLLKYGERFEVRSKPALITIDNIRVNAEGIANYGSHDAAIVIRAQGKFLNAGEMKLLMEIPVDSPEFSYRYSGSLSGMDLRALNSFLETAEQIRIKRGIVQSAAFEIDVVSGHANGNVRAEYKDLAVAAIDKQTGSEKGISDRASTIIAKILKIRGSNVPGNSGSFKIGKANYTLLRGEFFFEFSWFSLRSGVKDIVGF
jgi:hypothetical protein